MKRKGRNGREYSMFLWNVAATAVQRAMYPSTADNSIFPRNKNAALPVRAQKTPLPLSGLKTTGPGVHLRSRAFCPKRVSWLPAYGRMSATSLPVSCSGGEDARFHGRFIRSQYSPRHHFVDTSADASRPCSVIVNPAISAFRLLCFGGSLWRLPRMGAC